MCARAQEIHFGGGLRGVRRATAESKLTILRAGYVMKCTTVPALYLSRQNTNSEGEMVIQIVMQNNEFVGPGSPEFHAQLIDADPLTCREGTYAKKPVHILDCTLRLCNVYFFGSVPTKSGLL